MSETFTCGRRVENGMDRDDGPLRGSGKNLDSYESRHGLVGQPLGCTYCGSMPADAFMEAVRTGVEIGATDKSYKFYVSGLPLGEPTLRCTSSSNHRGIDFRPYNELTKPEKRAVKAAGYGKRKDQFFGGFQTYTTYEAKFYTQHLSEEQGWEFAELRKAGVIVWQGGIAPYVPLYIPGPSTQKAAEA